MALLSRERSLHLLDKIVSLDKQIDYPWSRGSWESTLSSHNYFVFSMDRCESNFALICYDPSCCHADLLKIVVSENKRRGGLGQMLLEEVFSYLRKRGALTLLLEVSTINQSAISFYKRLGFQKLVMTEGFYSDGQDAYRMVLNL